MDSTAHCHTLYRSVTGVFAYNNLYYRSVTISEDYFNKTSRTMVFITETFVCDFTNLNDIEKNKKSPLRKFCLGYDKTNFYLVDYDTGNISFSCSKSTAVVLNNGKKLTRYMQLQVRKLLYFLRYISVLKLLTHFETHTPTRN